MKKYVSILLILMFMIMPIMGIDAKTTTTTTKAGKKVNLYVFYSDTCSNCSNLHNYISSELSKDKDYNYMYELVDYEASNTYNANLMTMVSDQLNISADNRNKVPLVVIGEQYLIGFSAESSPEKIKEAIEKAYTEEQEDIVAGLAEGTITVPDKNLDENETNTDATGIIILVIIGIIIVGIIYSRSKTKEN